MKDSPPPGPISPDDEGHPSGDPSKAPDPMRLARRVLEQHPSFEEFPRTLADDRGGRIPERTTIGPYKVLEFIGRGGFGDVYLCQEIQKPQRKLAVKVIRPGLDTKDVLARFEAEKNALRLMNHPAIARIIDSGATEDGRPYFAMEYIRGQKLTEFCSKEQLTLEERLQLFIDICHGVQHAHAKSVVHRDLKPSNILVTRVDGEIQAKIIDFGLVKSLQQPLSDQTLHTQNGALIGTYEYMSPEQARWTPSEIDTRADIYALGAILYQLLTGEMAFSGLRECSYADALDKIGYEEPMRPSLRLRSVAEKGSSDHVSTLRTGLEQLTRRLQTDLDWVVMKALEKDPDRRFQTVQELARDIEHYLAGEMVEARPPSVSYRLKKTVRRHRGVLSATALVFVALVVGMTWALIERGKAEALAGELNQVIRFQEEQFKGIDLPGMGAGLRRNLIDQLMVSARRSGLSDEDLDRWAVQLEAAHLDWTGISKETLRANIFGPALETIEEQFGNQPLVRARLLQTVASTLLGLGLYEMATAPQEKALSIQREILGSDNPWTLKSITNMGVLLKAQGKNTEAMLLLEEALEGQSSVLGDHHRDTLTTISNIGLLLRRQGQIEEAQAFHEEALEGRRRAFGNADSDTLDSINNMGILLKLQDKLEQAKALYEEALIGRRQLLGDDHPDTLSSIHNMGALLLKQEKLAEAKRCFEETLAIKRRVLGNDHSSTINSISNMGRLFRRVGKPALAEPFMVEALENSRRMLGDDHPDTLDVINSFGLVLMDLERYEEAQLLMEEALETRRRVLGPDHRRTTGSISNMGLLYKLQGRFEEAKPYYESALAIRSRTLGDDHNATLASMHNLGALYRDIGNLDEAQTLAAEAVERGRANKALCLGRFIDGYSHTLVEMGRFAEAEPLAVEACSLLEESCGTTHRLTVEVIDNLVDLYNAWHQADPQAGHDKSAQKWQAKRDRATAAREETDPEPPPAVSGQPK